MSSRPSGVASWSRLEHRKPVIDILTAAIDKMKQTQEWKDFSRVNLQSSPNISLEDMQRLVAGEISSDRAFLENGGFLKRMN